MPQVSLLETFERLLNGWSGVFSQQRTFERVRRLTLGLLVSVRTHLISNAICATGRQFQDWTGDYRVWSQSLWQERELFDPILDALPALLSAPDAPVLVALDDTMANKTGRHIPGIALGRDPLSPPFHVNLRYGLRFVQASAIVYPAAGGAGRALPLRFELAPPAIKPKAVKPKTPPATDPDSGKPAETQPSAPLTGKAPRQPLTPEEIAYKEEKKLRRLPQVGLNVISSLRQSMDQRLTLQDRKLMVVGDGSYTNGLVLRGLPHDTIYIGRIRKDVKLQFPLKRPDKKMSGRPRRYGPEAPTPDQILHNDDPWIEIRCFVAGEFRQVSVKVLKTVYWRKAGADIPLQVVVIKAPKYRRRQGGKASYRQPAYLLSTDPELSVQTLVQCYFYRWEIECNHRDEKSLLGVAQGHMRNPEAVRRLPQLQVAAYSLLLLASLLTSGFHRDGNHYLPLPKWRNSTQPTRPSLQDLLNLLRAQIFARDLLHPTLGSDHFVENSPQTTKPPKPLSPDNLATFAA